MQFGFYQSKDVALAYNLLAQRQLQALLAGNLTADLAAAECVVCVDATPATAPELAGKKVAVVALQELLDGKVTADALAALAADYVEAQVAPAAALAAVAPVAASGTGTTNVAELAQKAKDKTLKVVAVTACPSGVAHTFMSAEAVNGYCQRQGWKIKVETRGQVGVGNEITPAEVQEADLVFVACDIGVDLSKFAGKLMYRTSTGLALKKTAQEFEKAFTQATLFSGDGAAPAQAAAATEAKKENTVYQHLMSGVSHMLPITVAGGLLIAFSFLFGVNAFQEEGTLAAHLMSIGGGSAFALMLAVFSGYVALSIADRPGLAPGLISGFLVTNSLGAGFLGAIVTGFFSGYLTRFLNRAIKLPASVASLKPILILPVLSSGIVGLASIYAIGPFVSSVNASLTEYITSLQGSNAIFLGLLLGAMMCVDLGGPVNKAAYVVSVGLIGSGVTNTMAAVMAAGMVPPIGMAIATWLARRKFTKAQRDSGNVAFVLGMCFISEGAIPFAAADPIRVIGSSIVGGAITGAISMYFNLKLAAPHGGIFVVPFVENGPLLYLAAIAIGAVVTGVIYSIIKQKPVEA